MTSVKKIDDEYSNLPTKEKRYYYRHRQGILERVKKHIKRNPKLHRETFKRYRESLGKFFTLNSAELDAIVDIIIFLLRTIKLNPGKMEEK